jgi:outer membrane lipoprotein SlyB
LLTGPASFFGSMPFGADLAWQVVVLNRLVLSLAALYGRAPSGRDRMAGVAAAAGAGLSSEALRQGLVRLLRRIAPRRSAARTAIGALAGGALGYLTAVAVGGWAREQFRAGRLLAPLRRVLA